MLSRPCYRHEHGDRWAAVQFDLHLWLVLLCQGFDCVAQEMLTAVSGELEHCQYQFLEVKDGHATSFTEGLR